jgi:hypothetical protein
LQCILTRQSPTVERVWIIHAPENNPSGVGMTKAGLLPIGQLSFRSDGGVGLAPFDSLERAQAGAALLCRCQHLAGRGTGLPAGERGAGEPISGGPQLGARPPIGASLWGAPAMPRETRTEGMLLQTSQRSVDATTAEGLERAADDVQLQAAPSLGDRPLIVLAAGQNMAQTPYWAEAQRRQAALSTNGRLIVAAGTISTGSSRRW